MWNLKSGFMKFITGRAGIYNFIIGRAGIYWSFCYFFFSWAIMPVGAHVSYKINWLVLCIMTFGTSWSVLRTLFGKEVKIIHKISSAFVAILLAIIWLFVLSAMYVPD